MHAIRRTAVAVLVAVGSLGLAGAAAVVTATPGAAALTCTDSWQGPATGSTDWSASAANWSAGFPTSTSVVCISEPGTYTVDLTGGVSVGALQVGGAASGTQTLTATGSGTSVILSLGSASVVAKGGVLQLAPATNGYVWLGGGPVTVASGGMLSDSGSGNIAYLRASVTNQSGGTVALGAASTLQDQGTATTNDGTFSVPSGGTYSVTAGSDSFTNAGSLTVSGVMAESAGTFTQTSGSIAGNPVIITGGTVADTAGTGAFDVQGSASLSGTVPAGQTVTVDGTFTSVLLTLTGPSITVGGRLALAASPSGYAWLGGSPVTVASGGTLSDSGSVNVAYLRTSVTNQSGGTVTLGAANTQQDQGTSLTNDGSATVSSGASYTLDNGSDSFTNAGSLTVSGVMTQSGGTFTQTSGSIAGHPVTVTGGAIADTSGTGAFDVQGSASLSGTVPVGQTVTVDGTFTSVVLTLTGTSVTVNGGMVLAPATNGYALLSGSPVTVASGASLSDSGSSNIAYLRTSVTNQSGGTVNLGAATTLQDQGTATTNDGTFTVPSGGTYSVTSGSGFTNAGTLTVSGVMAENSGTFTQTSGSIAGHPVIITGGTVADNSGTGAFDVQGSASLSGTVPAGQTVTVDGIFTSVVLTLSGTVTDNGSVVLTPSSNGYALLSGSPLDVASGGALSTSGVGSPAYLRVPVAVAAGGTVTIRAADSRQDTGTATTNAGVFQVMNGGALALSGSSTLSGAGTFGVTVNGGAGTGGISGPGTTLSPGSTLAVATVGSPAVGSIFQPFGGPVVGTFSTLSFGSGAYAVSYPAGAVQLTTEAPFTLTAAPLTAKENIGTGTVVLANIGSASDGTGVYSATVNWGDGSATGPATVNITGNTGTVTGSHTYTSPGTHTVTTTLANTDGTTLVTSTAVTVTGPTITGFSKTVVAPGKKLATVVSGTGFDSSATVTVSDPSVTVLSVKVGKPSKKHPNPTLKLKLSVAKTATAGSFSVTVTETGGTVTAVGALSVS
jgi:fibronectin-binding autotransporter adhesin